MAATRWTSCWAAIKTTLHGDAGADVLLGEAGNDVLNGGTGADQMDGGTGDDTYYLDHVVDQITGDGAGYDVAYASTDVDLSKMNGGKGIEKLVGTSDLAVNLSGSNGANEIVGTKVANVLRGFGGADTLNGGAGADKMYGGTGGDTYVVDNAGDLVDETGSDATVDTVRSTMSSFSLANGNQVVGAVENLVYAGPSIHNVVLTGNGLGNLLDASKSLSSKLDGGMGKDTLIGGAGADQLVGGSGEDVMKGGGGDDTYVVDASLDGIVEASGGGIDTVRTYIDYTLSANVENGILLDTIGGTLKGNESANTLTGDDGHDKLYGYGNNDKLIGGFGNDVLDGGAGNDTMEGGVHNDIYYVDSTGDKVVELDGAGSGTDEVRTRLAYYALGANVENLEGLLAQDFTGIGNGHDNRIASDDGNDELYGLEGRDTLLGYGGADDLYGGTGQDVLNGGTGADNLYGGLDFDVASYEHGLVGVNIDLQAQTASGGEATGDKLSMIEGAIGSKGGDMLRGHSGVDSLDGREGNDVIYGSLGADKLTGGAGVDQLNYASSNAAVVVNLTTGAASGGHAQGETISGFEDVTGSNHADTITGTAGANTLYGLQGGDKLYGNGDADRLWGGLGSDLLNGGAGNDILNGEDGDDVLVGGAGHDSLSGGTGADDFVFDSALGASSIDKVVDFNVAADTMQIDNAVFAAFSKTGKIIAGNFRVNTTGQAQDADDRIIYDQDSGGVFYDADGSGAVAAIQFATVSMGLPLTSDDFEVI